MSHENLSVKCVKIFQNKKEIKTLYVEHIYSKHNKSQMQARSLSLSLSLNICHVKIMALYNNICAQGNEFNFSQRNCNKKIHKNLLKIISAA